MSVTEERTASSVLAAIHGRIDASLEQISSAIGAEPLDAALRRIGAAPGPDRDVVVAYDALLAELSRHLIGMQMAVLPVVARRLPASSSGLPGHLREVRRMERTMRRIEQLLWGDARAPSRNLYRLHHELVDQMRVHRRDEEAVLARLETTLSAAQCAALAERLQAATARAPTRTHPHAAVRFSVTRVLCRPVAWWDHLLDVLNGRTVPRFGPAPPVREPGLWGSYLLGRPLPEQRQERGRQAPRR